MRGRIYCYLIGSCCLNLIAISEETRWLVLWILMNVSLPDVWKLLVLGRNSKKQNCKHSYTNNHDHSCIKSHYGLRKNEQRKWKWWQSMNICRNFYWQSVYNIIEFTEKIFVKKTKYKPLIYWFTSCYL